MDTTDYAILGIGALGISAIAYFTYSYLSKQNSNNALLGELSNIAQSNSTLQNELSSLAQSNEQTQKEISNQKPPLTFNIEPPSSSSLNTPNILPPVDIKYPSIAPPSTNSSNTSNTSNTINALSNLLSKIRSSTPPISNNTDNTSTNTSTSGTPNILPPTPHFNIGDLWQDKSITPPSILHSQMNEIQSQTNETKPSFNQITSPSEEKVSSVLVLPPNKISKSITLPSEKTPIQNISSYDNALIGDISGGFSTASKDLSNGISIASKDISGIGSSIVSGFSNLFKW